MKKLIFIGLIIGIVLISGCGCTEEAKICPDGSSVGRNSMKFCRFDPCPEINELIIEYGSAFLHVNIKDNKMEYNYNVCEDDSCRIVQSLEGYSNYKGSFTLTDDEINKLLNEFNRYDFFSLEDKYGDETPRYQYSIRLKINEKDKTIVFNQGRPDTEMPRQISDIIQAIEELFFEKFNENVNK